MLQKALVNATEHLKMQFVKHKSETRAAKHLKDLAQAKADKEKLEGRFNREQLRQSNKLEQMLSEANAEKDQIRKDFVEEMEQLEEIHQQEIYRLQLEVEELKRELTAKDDCHKKQIADLKADTWCTIQ